MVTLEDITKDLPSLQFDSALPEEERKDLLRLRCKNLTVISTACAQAVYFVSILNEANQLILEKSRCSTKSCITSSFSGLKAGIIGCGRLGKQLATLLLELGVVKASNLYISTRCPENLEAFQSKGAFCCFDNIMVSESVDILFLCCLPSQLNTVAKDLRGNLNCLVYAFTAGMSLARISQLLDNYQNIIKPSFIFSSNIDQIFNDSNPWKFGKNITEILADPKCILHTCPLYHDANSLLEKDVKLSESFVLAVLNECTKHGIERDEAVSVCNSTLFGVTSEGFSCLYVEDILMNDETKNREPEDKLFKIFDLVNITSDETLFGKKLREDDALIAAFTEKYQKVLQKGQQNISVKQQSTIFGGIGAVRS